MLNWLFGRSPGAHPPGRNAAHTGIVLARARSTRTRLESKSSDHYHLAVEMLDEEALRTNCLVFQDTGAFTYLPLAQAGDNVAFKYDVAGGGHLKLKSFSIDILHGRTGSNRDNAGRKLDGVVLRRAVSLYAGNSEFHLAVQVLGPVDDNAAAGGVALAATAGDGKLPVVVFKAGGGFTYLPFAQAGDRVRFSYTLAATGHVNLQTFSVDLKEKTASAGPATGMGTEYGSEDA